MLTSRAATIAVISMTLLVIAESSLPDLKFYNPANPSDLKKLHLWAKIVSSVKHQIKNNANVALQLLSAESCASPSSARCSAFQQANSLKKTSPGLTLAECLAATMYTGPSFYRELNSASVSGNWGPYKVHTYLLYCALHKLSLNPVYRVQSSYVLYRNLKGKYGKPNVPRLFWKAFSSTSLNKNVASGFGQQGTRLQFLPQASKYGARIDHLSIYPGEQEVLLTPFEAFDVLPDYNPHIPQFNFRRSQNQELRYLKYMCK